MRDFEALRSSIKSGVKVVTADQLFPTPYFVVSKMLDYAQLEAGNSVLDPSAGTGAILKRIPTIVSRVTGIEINYDLSQLLSGMFNDVNHHIFNADFLTFNSAYKFDRIIMNPPFSNGADIKHIKHAIRFLNPNGIIVACCADGPRQTKELMPIVENTSGVWEPLPANTFQLSGTCVNTLILTIHN